MPVDLIVLQTPQHTFILSIHDSDKWLLFCWSAPLPSLPFLLRGRPFRLREEHPGTEMYTILRTIVLHFSTHDICNLILQKWKSLIWLSSVVIIKVQLMQTNQRKQPIRAFIWVKIKIKEYKVHYSLELSLPKFLNKYK